ncbi:serine hydrolase domain-containing protein [Larkinella soli]|uniref:serine hydrolase domain-containing protein n=1 Tax=Larkinella soli TaxID=1770527 RepID=UPI001E56E35D|nr:serine hydrolase domain-containing protein [Larkinella soli]
MRTYLFGGFVFLLLAGGCSVYRQDLPMTSCGSAPVAVNPAYSRAAQVRQAMEQLNRAGVPGCAMAVYSAEGWWETAAGYAKIEDKTVLQTCHLQYLQSIAKLYMAVAVLKLAEQGKINLDEPITRYLPARYSRYVTDAGQVTVRMLLNHTSGIPEYNFAPAYVTRLLQHPDHLFSPEDYLKYIEGKPLTFKPGSRYSYRNTNYVLLALLTDALTGSHARYMTETIFTPLGLKQTFYRDQPGYLNYPNLVNSYWDRYSDGILENASRLQRNNVASLVGDDGIVATPADAVTFLRGLLEGKLLSAATLEQMKTWVKDGQGKPAYGLGLDYTTLGGEEAWGHSGGGIGAGCELYYFPRKNVYVFIGLNLGTVTDSPLHPEAVRARDQFYEAILK